MWWRRKEEEVEEEGGTDAGSLTLSLALSLSSLSEPARSHPVLPLTQFNLQLAPRFRDGRARCSVALWLALFPPSWPGWYTLGTGH